MSESLKAKLAKLQELLELGLFTQDEFDAERRKLAAEAMGQVTGTPDPLAGATRIAPATDPLSGATRMAPDADAAPSAGLGADIPSQLGSYKVLGVLGAGGMGTVVRARHVREGWARRTGDVAIKLIRPEIAQDPSFQERFFGEADLGKQVQHPCLAAVYDVISDGPWLGTVMELVEGESLTSLVSPGGRPLAEVSAMLRALAEGLDHLHDSKIVHRDIKPDNIKLRPDGTPVLLDLGIAKDTQAATGSGQTQSFTFMGTNTWMAPEQVDAGSVGSAADRYALGLVTYQLLSGRLPWPAGANDSMVLVSKATGRLEPLRAIQPDLSAEAAEAVMKMLAVEPGDRFETSVAFVDALVGGPDGASPEPAATAQPVTLAMRREAIRAFLAESSDPPPEATRHVRAELGLSEEAPNG